MNSDNAKKQSNLDPITGQPGAHPLGVGLGAAAGGIATGAAAGTLAAGPIGTVIGAAVGAVAGGLGGKAVAEHFDPTVERNYWRENHLKQAYFVEGEDYEAYEPAFQLGGQSRDRYANKSFDDVEPSLATDYAALKGEGHVSWDKAKHATRAAWDRITNASK